MSQRIDPSRLPLMLSVGFGGLAAVLYLFCVAPASDSLDALHRTRGELEFQLSGVQRDLRGSKDVKERLNSLANELAPYEAGLLKPLLGSWAMRAKSLLDPLADGVGLKGVEFTELPTRALPLTKPVPVRLTVRRPVKMTCRGGYAAIASFLLRVERDFPLVSEQAVRIASGQKGDEQTAEIVFEWPAEGNLSAPPKSPAKGKGGKVK